METNMSPEARKELDDLKAALVSEFQLNKESDASPHRKDALKELEDLKPDMLASIEWILKHSVNDALKAKVAMWGFDRLLEQGKVDADPLSKFLQGMVDQTETKAAA